MQKNLVSDFGFSPVLYTKQYIVWVDLVLAAVEMIVLLWHGYNWAKE